MMVRVVGRGMRGLWLQHAHQIMDRKDTLRRQFQHATGPDDHAVHGLAIDAVIHHGVVTGVARAFNEFTPEDDSITAPLEFTAYGEQSAEYRAELASLVQEGARKPGDKSARFVALIESRGQRVVRSRIFQAGSKKFGRIEQPLCGVFLPRFLDQRGDLSEIAAEILNLNRWRLQRCRHSML